MAKFEIELPDDIATTLRVADRRSFGGPLEAAIATLPVLHDLSNQYARELDQADVETIAKLFVSLGRLLDRSVTGAHRSFVSVEEREKRSARARRAYETRKGRQADEAAPDRKRPDAGNVVALFPSPR